MKNEKGSVPLRYWALWWTLIVIADFVFYVLLTPIEFVSTFIIRPFTLAVRLFANMFAGHLLVLIFFSGALYMWSVGGLQYAFGTLAAAMGIVLTFFELLIISLQAYIFVTLTAVYVSESLADEH